MWREEGKWNYFDMEGEEADGGGEAMEEDPAEWLFTQGKPGK